MKPNPFNVKFETRRDTFYLHTGGAEYNDPGCTLGIFIQIFTPNFHFFSTIWNIQFPVHCKMDQKWMHTANTHTHV